MIRDEAVKILEAKQKAKPKQEAKPPTQQEAKPKQQAKPKPEAQPKQRAKPISVPQVPQAVPQVNLNSPEKEKQEETEEEKATDNGPAAKKAKFSEFDAAMASQPPSFDF